MGSQHPYPRKPRCMLRGDLLDDFYPHQHFSFGLQKRFAHLRKTTLTQPQTSRRPRVVPHVFKPAWSPSKNQHKTFIRLEWRLFRMLPRVRTWHLARALRTRPSLLEVGARPESRPMVEDGEDEICYSGFRVDGTGTPIFLCLRQMGCHINHLLGIVPSTLNPL